MYKHENIGTYITGIAPDSVMVEIGADRDEGSSMYLADLAQSFGVKLISVDLVSRNHVRQQQYTKAWNIFYNNVKDPKWPQNPAHLDELPKKIKDECLTLHKWEEHLEVAIGKINAMIAHPSIEWCVDEGVKWSKEFAKKYNKKISVLYLDNFDYNPDITLQMPWILQQIAQYKEQFGIEMNNFNCQLAHFTQMFCLLPSMTNDCVVALDDTYTYNDCWIGKSGPAVIFLLSQGFEIMFNSEGFLILKRKIELDAPNPAEEYD